MRAFAVLAAAAFLTACAGKADKAQPQATPTLLIASRGEVVTLEQAVRQIHFAPFIPSEQIMSIALIPPLSDAGKKAAQQPGLAIEYEQRGDALVLSQWPRNGLDITLFATDLTTRPCAPIAYKADGLIWTTRNGRVMTLQPDGAVLPARLTREANRLLHAGACGQSPTTPRRTPFPRASRPRNPSASLPRR